MKKCHSLFAFALAGLLMSCNAAKKTESTQQTAPKPTAEDTTSVTIPENEIVVHPTPYRASFSIVNDVVHTKLDIKFDWQRQHALGKAWITLKPHFYATDSLTLDAKSFDVNQVALVTPKGNVPLKYTYDSLLLKISLDKTYKKDESYTVFIDYTAKPNEVKQEGSSAINEAKGLYFINA
ncbi:MAG: hypothetical protein ACHQD9_07980, partial [Chitinophagales bacterium]